MPQSSRPWIPDLRRVALGGLVGVLALTTAIDVGTTQRRLHRRAEALGRARVVAVARHDLVVGSHLARRDLRAVSRHEVAPGALSPRAARGRRLAIPLLRGSVVTARALGPASRGVPVGTRAVRLRSADARRLHPGDRVDVLVTLDADRPAGDEPTLTVAAAVEVLDVERDRSEDAAAVVAIPVAFVPRAAFATASGTITLARVPDAG